MSTISLGNDSITYTIKGLSPLRLAQKRGSYFDGYVTSVKDLRHIFVTSDFNEVKKMEEALSKAKLGKSLRGVQPKTLAVLKMLRNWARVIVLKRTSTSTCQVHFVDTGETKEVDINHLYQMPKSFIRQPPLAFPVNYDTISLQPEISANDIQELVGARIAFQIEPNSPSDELICSQISVFDSQTQKRIDLLNALRERRSAMEKIDHDPFPRNLPKSEQRTDNKLPNGSGNKIDQAKTSNIEGISGNSSLFVTNYFLTSTFAVVMIILGVIAALVVIGVIGIFVYRKYKNKKEAQERRQHQAEQRLEGLQARLEPPASIKSVPKEIPSHCTSTVSKQQEPVKPTIDLTPDEIAVVAACIGVGKHMRNQQNAENRDSEIERNAENASPQQHSDGSSEDHLPIGAKEFIVPEENEPARIGGGRSSDDSFWSHYGPNSPYAGVLPPMYDQRSLQRSSTPKTRSMSNIRAFHTDSSMRIRNGNLSSDSDSGLTNMVKETLTRGRRSKQPTVEDKVEMWRTHRSIEVRQMEDEDLADLTQTTFFTAQTSL